MLSSRIPQCDPLTGLFNGLISTAANAKSTSKYFIISGPEVHTPDSNSSAKIMCDYHPSGSFHLHSCSVFRRKPFDQELANVSHLDFASTASRP